VPGHVERQSVPPKILDQTFGILSLILRLRLAFVGKQLKRGIRV
jgi:hypothetical protein